MKGATKSQLKNSLRVLYQLQLILEKSEEIMKPLREYDITTETKYILAVYLNSLESSMEVNSINMDYLSEQIQDLITLEKLMTQDGG
jgi:hypothetical protein